MICTSIFVLWVVYYLYLIDFVEAIVFIVSVDLNWLYSKIRLISIAINFESEILIEHIDYINII